MLANNDTAGALQSYQKELDLHKAWAEVEPSNLLLLQNLAAFKQRNAVGLRHAGQTDEANRYYTAALLTAENAVQRSPDTVRLQIVLITILDSYGYFESTRDDSAAAELYNRALSIARELEKKGKLAGEDLTWIDCIQGHIDALDIEKTIS